MYLDLGDVGMTFVCILIFGEHNYPGLNMCLYVRAYPFGVNIILHGLSFVLRFVLENCRIHTRQLGLIKKSVDVDVIEK